MAHTALMRTFILSFLLCGILFGTASAHASERYAVANLPTPMFNVSDIGTIFGGADGATLATDNCNQLRQLEFVALPGTVFTVTGTVQGRHAPVFRVTTADYPYPSPGGYFIDSRFVTLSKARPPERPRRLPSRETITERLHAAQGSIYVWGGNVRSGIGEMSELYPARKYAVLPELVQMRWNLQGVDCSGLLYEATDGFTPRNTSALISFGTSVPIAGLATAEIVRRVEPLDLIVWKGHVLIILDREKVIESYLDCAGTGGMRVRTLPAALEGIRKKRAPFDAWPAEKEKQESAFVIRRWYPAVLH